MLTMNISAQPILENLQHLETSLFSLSLILFCIIFAEIGVDFFFRKQRNYRETAANIGVGIVHDFLSDQLANVVAVVGLSLIAAVSPLKVPVNGWTMLLAVFIADFLYYWNHRAEHRIRFFWAYHSVHHSSTDFNLTVALRLAWVEDFILWIFYIPMALLGFHPLQVLIALEVVGLYQVWIHNQKIGRLGILESMMNTASNHRVHHGSNLPYIDKNYGGILIVWDRLFGTYQAETEKVIYGLTENIQTHNPIQINIMEYSRIISDLRRSQTLKEWFLSLFGPPEWKPQAFKQLPSKD
ncbi:MAG: sterol desaturase family protein [Oscillatoriales cyanobacterium]|nr:MAG: sterol desaturase family protein [Oscillatoriales cyanobacterium]TAF91593.1 MAG: sterol desaturase family protein [Oscillatoriales cyanobacterium]TAG59165.1 MAG: sterol desaturase family protein [Oscillatoriales cyanobacterium]TAG99143.1 MAG: sterol desaturase family protein [Oscillatoriales cyanobacterium]